MSYTDVFGSDAIPPAGNAYDTYTLTTNTTFVWSYNAANTDTAIAKIMDVTPSAGVAMTFPPANDVSNGEDFLLRNVGAETLTVKDNAGTTIDTVAAGVSKYYFVSSNATAAGTWGSVTFGAGSSSATAGDLIGYGIKAITTTLNQKHTVTTDASNVTVDATYRAGLLVSTGGAVTIALTAAATLGNDFFFLYRNEGTGTATFDPNGSETFDGAATFTVQPGESLTAVCSGTAWYSVGYGRSTLYQFTQLVKDVSAAGEFTLSASEASNKLLSFSGNPASAVTVIVPNTVAIYYVQSAISTAQAITVKTAAGTGTEVAQSAKVILLCDATNVSTAQTAIASGGIALDSGSASAPSLNFSSSTNSGLFLKGATGVGIAVDGVEVIAVEEAGITLAQPLVTPVLGVATATSINGHTLLGTTAATAQASTSGTAIDFTSIPAGVTRITILFYAVGTNGTDTILVQIGDSGGIETSNYGVVSHLTDNSSSITALTGAQISLTTTASLGRTGRCVIENITGNQWLFSGMVTASAAAAPTICNGSKTLSGTLDRVRITTTLGTDTFDTGTINIIYE